MYVGSVGCIKRKRIVDETGIRYPLEAFTVMIQTPRGTKTVIVPMNEHNVNVLEGAKIRKGMPVWVDGEINAFLTHHGKLLFVMYLSCLQTSKKPSQIKRKDEKYGNH